MIGGSVGGGIAWEMIAIEPKLTQNLIAIATDWKSTDWLIANCYLQEKILNNSRNPIEDARIHAMMCYRTPESFKEKYRLKFAELPLPAMSLAVVVGVFCIYQMVSGDMQPFIYFQF